jgi:dipeptidyl aminopeptidase/acylaminoacyl peptidase
MRRIFYLALAVLACLPLAAQQGPKPRVTLDEFFDSVSINAAKPSPDGTRVLIATERADWKAQRFRNDIWLWTEGGGAPVLLTQSGHDSDPQWSPDGKWIAFISDREPAPDEEEQTPVPNELQPETTRPVQPPRRAKEEEKEIAHVYMLPLGGGEAVPVTRGLEEVHAFAWSPDSKAIYFATRVPWSKAKRDAYKKEWADAVRYREQERGDVIARIPIQAVLARQASIEQAVTAKTQQARIKEPLPETAETPGSEVVSTTPWRIREIVISPDGAKLVFNTDSVSQRMENVSAYEVYVVSLPHGAPQQITHNEAEESHLSWAPDSRTLWFSVPTGSVEGKFHEVQPRVYSVDVATGATTQWAAKFQGCVNAFTALPQGGIVAAGRLGTEVPVYVQKSATSEFVKVPSWPGTYERIESALHSPRVAIIYSAQQRPTEVYLAESVDRIDQAKPITGFNELFTQRDLPQSKPFTWKAEDGSTVEGVLVYPPGQFEAKNLPTFTFIHGGPEDADGNKFGADWYDWAILAASNGWLVFRPNYRGSTGYGDQFELGIVPQIVSRPGKDILEGVDALVKDGIADPQRLTIGGYSYGGYMTNWLITQTTRFKAAVTGAGAVEHTANWGNDDLTFDDAWYLGGMPWEVPNNYNSEAAIWQINKVKTPTHMVAGGDDIRVSVAESYLMERALHALQVPSSLLIFPGEGHPLAKNPWHGKIKVREELKWLEQYGGMGAAAK